MINGGQFLHLEHNNSDKIFKIALSMIWSFYILLRRPDIYDITLLGIRYENDCLLSDCVALSKKPDWSKASFFP